MPRTKKLPPGLWKRGDTYYARFRHGGRLIRKKLSTDLRAACDILTDIRARASRGDFGLTDNDYSWADLKKEFLRWARQALRDPEVYERDLRHLEAYCGIKSIRQVTHAFVIGYREWRLAQTIRSIAGQTVAADKARQVCPRTVNREVGTLQNMLNKGVAWSRIGFNPIADLKPLKQDEARKQRRALTVEEVESILREAPAWLRAPLRLWLTTGMRRNELVELRFSDVDFERRCLTIRASIAKSRKDREVPLDDETLGLLCNLRNQAEDRQPVPGHTAKQTAQQVAAFTREHVFVTGANTPLRNNVLRAFYAVCKRAGIEGAVQGGSVDIHAMRGTFVSLAIEHGANPKAVQSVVGHSTLAMTMGVYAKTNDRAKREAVGVLPFATVSAPDHVVTLDRLRTACIPSSSEAGSDSTQTVMASHVAAG